MWLFMWDKSMSRYGIGFYNPSTGIWHCEYTCLNKTSAASIVHLLNGGNSPSALVRETISTLP